MPTRRALAYLVLAQTRRSLFIVGPVCRLQRRFVSCIPTVDLDRGFRLSACAASHPPAIPPFGGI